MLRNLTYVLVLLSMFSIGSCEEDSKPKIEGCTDELSLNFNPDATHDDGSCIFPSDQFIGNWKVIEQIIFFNSTTLTSTTISVIEYNAEITAVTQTEITITTDRPTAPAQIYTGNLTIDWANRYVKGPGAISGIIIDDDNFGVNYTYGTPAGVHMVEVVYERD